MDVVLCLPVSLFCTLPSPSLGNRSYRAGSAFGVRALTSRRTHPLHPSPSFPYRITILFIGQALAPNVGCLIAMRFIQGTFACIEGPVSPLRALTKRPS